MSKITLRSCDYPDCGSTGDETYLIHIGELGNSDIDYCLYHIRRIVQESHIYKIQALELDTGDPEGLDDV